MTEEEFDQNASMLDQSVQEIEMDNEDMQFEQIDMNDGTEQYDEGTHYSGRFGAGVFGDQDRGGSIVSVDCPAATDEDLDFIAEVVGSASQNLQEVLQLP